MRQWVVVVGFFIIVLIVIAGCTSQSGTPNGLKHKNLVTGSDTSKTTSPSLPATSSECTPSDPSRFQKFFPDIPGWTRKYYGTNTSDQGMLYGTSFINEMYIVSDTSKPRYRVIVGFSDRGPCVTSSTDGYWYLNNEKTGESDGIIISRIDNFHGYPAVQRITNASISKQLLMDTIWFPVNNRLSVTIGIMGENGSVPEAEANIETIATAIDFHGFASSV
jgi:hypothetical protein